MKYIKPMFMPILIGIMLVLCVFNNSFAQNTPNWWMINSLKLDSIPSGILFHAEGDYTFYTSSGNVKMTMHRGSPKIFVRNGRYLFEAFGSVNYQKLQVRTNPVSRTHVFTFNTKAIYDLTRSLQSETGILWEKDDGHFLDLRTVYYTGLIFNQMEHKSLGRLFFLAGGYQDLSSTQLPPGLGKDVEENQKFIIYALQSLVLKVIPRVQLIEKFTFIQELDDVKSYRTDFELKAQFMLTRNISGLIAYQAKYEKEPLIPELAPFTEQLNTSLTFGAKFNF